MFVDPAVTRKLVFSEILGPAGLSKEQMFQNCRYVIKSISFYVLCVGVYICIYVFYGKPFYYLLCKIDILYIISNILYMIQDI